MKRSVSCSKILKDTRNLKGGHELIFEASGLLVPAFKKGCNSGRWLRTLTPRGGVCSFKEKTLPKFKVFKMCPLILSTGGAQ